MLHDIAGWIGMALILLGYFLNSAGRVKSNSRAYQFINFFGACGILWNAIALKSWPVACLNVFWAVIALGSLIKIHAAKNYHLSRSHNILKNF